jgi:hypothetical protein
MGRSTYHLLRNVRAAGSWLCATHGGGGLWIRSCLPALPLVAPLSRAPRGFLAAMMKQEPCDAERGAQAPHEGSEPSTGGRLPTTTPHPSSLAWTQGFLLPPVVTPLRRESRVWLSRPSRRNGAAVIHSSTPRM